MPGTNVWTCATLCLLVSAVVAQAALPEPPRQHRAWVQHFGESIPDQIVRDVASLFDAGFADPRGGTYREIELAGSGDDKSTLQTHGWVFPENYAVCWNGLVYRVRSVGAPVDLDRDVGTILDVKPGSGGLSFRREPPRADAAFWFNMELGQPRVPASIALLLRLGRPDLASQLWRLSEANETEWFFAAERAWLGTAFLRLAGARTRGDDQDAADVAESLLGWESRVWAMWKKLPASPPDQLADLSFLKPVPILLADSRRRMREPARQYVDFQALIQKTGALDSAGFLKRPQAARIADLVDRLEDVWAEKAAWPGPLMYSFEPICELLTREGEAAVAPLLDVYEHDQRLSRTLDYWRPWAIARTPIPVSQVAKVILGQILQAPDLVEHSTPAELRAWWEKHAASTIVDRSYELLADDHAVAERWLDSADFLTLRSDVQRPGRITLAENCSPKKPLPAAYGENLRARQSPSVSELLAKRTATLAASKQVPAACRMAFMTFLWEPKISLPALQTAGSLEACQGDSLVTVARMSLGDARAAAEWAAAIRIRVSEPAIRTSELSPLWMFPDDPALEQVAEWLFTRPESPLSPAVEYQQIHSPLLAAPPYRRAVVAALNDNSVVGKATRSPEGLLSYDVKNGGGGSSAPGTDPRQVPPGQERPLRVKDLTAWELSQLDGAPEFQPDWPESDRDTAIASIAEFLRMHEKELRAFPAKPQETTCPAEYVYLDH